MPSYPVISLLVRHGGWAAIVLALICPVAGTYLAATGAGWLFLPGGVLVGGLLYIVLKSYVELTSLISDMLLPK